MLKSHKPEIDLVVTTKNESRTIPFRGTADDLLIVNGKEYPMKSYMYNWSVLFYYLFTETSPSVPNRGLEYDNTSYVGSYNCLIYGDTGDATEGVIVGSSTTETTHSDYNLGSLIAHGTGAGQLLYNASCTISDFSDTSLPLIYEIRAFINAGDAPVNVSEVAVMAYHNYAAADMMIIKDSIDTTTILPNHALHVMYKWHYDQSLGFVVNWPTLLYGMFTYTAPTITNTAGSPIFYSQSYFDTGYKCSAAANEDSYGLIVGTDDSAMDSTDYNLGSQIAHGAGLGQLSHGAVSFEECRKDATGESSWMSISRVFTNSSGADITVEEVGLASEGQGGNRYLMWRGLTNGVTVSNGETVTIKLIFRYSNI